MQRCSLKSSPFGWLLTSLLYRIWRLLWCVGYFSALLVLADKVRDEVCLLWSHDLQCCEKFPAVQHKMKVTHTNGTRVQVSYNDLILSVLTYQKYISGNIFRWKKYCSLSIQSEDVHIFLNWCYMTKENTEKKGRAVPFCSKGRKKSLQQPECTTPGQ